jgi:hypothetical protein
MFERIPQLVDEAVGEDFLRLGVIGQAGDDLDSPLHDHGLVILLRLALELGRDNLEEGLELCPVLVPQDHISANLSSTNLSFQEH